MVANTILIIAYGNSLRRDDGAGLVLGRQLASAWQNQGIHLTLLETHQLTPELALEIAQPTVAAVVFVDTRDAAHHPSESNGQESTRLRQLVVDGEDSPSLGHQLNPTTLCIYAGNLYNHQPPAWLITVPGWDFGHGEGLSSQAQLAVEEVLRVAKVQLIDFICNQA